MADDNYACDSMSGDAQMALFLFSVYASNRRMFSKNHFHFITKACPRKNAPKYNGVIFEILGKHH